MALDQARSRISMFDIDGLLEPSRTGLSDEQKVYAHKAAPSKNFVKTIETLKPTILIGDSPRAAPLRRRWSRR